jgi:tRNA pseudouridine38-40 synthase
VPEHSAARFRATVHYDGTAFSGWQLQPEERTVQGVIEEALARLLTVPTRVTAAGRTDTGVHAVGQEIALDAAPHWSAPDLQRGLNALTPDDIWIEQVSRTRADFHPRYDAVLRRYEYVVGLWPNAASPLRSGRLWPLCREVDVALLADCTRHLPGERSFGRFAKSGQPERGTRCRVEEAGWRQTTAGDLVFTIVADRFLHRMVRYLVGTLIEIGNGQRDAEELSRLLDEDPEARPPSPAPPSGLYLTGVCYPEGWNRPPGIPGLPS